MEPIHETDAHAGHQSEDGMHSGASFSGGTSGTPFQDNRPELAAHQQRQSAANQSQQVRQLLALQSSSNVGHQAGFRGSAPIQLTAIHLRGQEIPGSATEDPAQFWEAFAQLPEPLPGQNLRDLIRILDPRWRQGEASDFDRRILSEAARRLSALAGYQYHADLTEDQEGQLKGAILGTQLGQDAQMDPIISQDAIVSQGANEIGTALATYASGEIKRARSSDKKEIDLGPNSKRGVIMQKAIARVNQRYGLKMMLGSVFLNHDDRAIDSLNHASLEHGTCRWENADEPKRQLEGRQAMEWAMASIGDITTAVQSVRAVHHKQSSDARVREAYGEYLANQGDFQDVLMELAEIRLRWGPITVGNQVFLQANNTNPKLEDEWWLLESLIHEAIHTAEHPNFTQFLQDYVPKVLHSDLREGAVEYLARQIWDELLANSPTDNQEDITSKPSESDGSMAQLLAPIKIAKSRKDNLMQATDRPYQAQVNVIAHMIKVLGGPSGRQRLENAYFTGQMKVFFPKFQQPEQEIDREDEEMSEVEGGIEEEMP